jgi:hypothetical protein
VFTLLRRVLTLLRRVLTLLRRVLTLLRRVFTLLRRVLTLLRPRGGRAARRRLLPRRPLAVRLRRWLRRLRGEHSVSGGGRVGEYGEKGTQAMGGPAITAICFMRIGTKRDSDGRWRYESNADLLLHSPPCSLC